MINAWDDLPNAKHIDRIIADMEKNPDQWNTARDISWTAAIGAARNAARADARNDAWADARCAARNAACGAAWTEARDAAWTEAWEAAFYVSWGAIEALIAYDYCAYLLDEKPEHVQILGLLGNHAAILLYPACVALQYK